MFCSLLSTRSAQSALIDSYSLTMIASGDISGEYSLSGLINSTTESVSDKENSNCSLAAYVRKVKNSNKIMLEIWPNFKCMIEGQEKELKLHKIYLDLDKTDQKKTITLPDKKIHKVTLEFKDLSLQKSK